MENLEIIISTASSALGLLIVAVTFIIKFIKALKSKNASEAARLLKEGVEQAVTLVEGIDTALSGTTKKELALTKVNQYCIDNGIAFDAEKASALIEEVITLTKTVNAREKDELESAASDSSTAAAANANSAKTITTY